MHILPADHLRNVAKYAFHRSIHLEPRSSTPYSTHLPVLFALSVLVGPVRVVEFGSGFFSTTAFKDRSLFPRLTSLLSFENDPQWYQTVAEHVGDDSRIALRLLDGPVKNVVAELNFDSVDLIFVDDSREHADRAATIMEIAHLRLKGMPTVIHDLDLWKIRRGAHHFEHVFCMDALNPQTGIAWNGQWQHAWALPKINVLLRQHSLSLAMNDPRWLQLFQSELRTN